MRLRLFFGAVLVCALVSVNGATAADAAPKRVFKGKTAQKRNIRLDVRPGSIKVIRFKARLACRDGTTLIVDESGFVRTPIRRGRFRDVQVGRTDEVFFRGTVKRRVVRGRLRVKDKLRNGVRCRSRWIRFTVRPR
ncbi:MAG TPA: hypothetical protein VFZ41_09045 [Solirubrobacterales bacterium]